MLLKYGYDFETLTIVIVSNETVFKIYIRCISVPQAPIPPDPTGEAEQKAEAEQDPTNRLAVQLKVI